MSDRYRVGIIGSAHMHINNVAGLFAEHPRVEKPMARSLADALAAGRFSGGHRP